MEECRKNSEMKQKEEEKKKKKEMNMAGNERTMERVSK